jgi:hypothetical protein
VAAAIALQGCATSGAEGQPRQATAGNATDRAMVTVTTTATTTATARDTGTAGNTGTGTGDQGPSSTPPSEPACTDITYADPWIAFEPALTDGDALVVGKRGWISTVHALDDIAVQGTPGTVELSEQSSPTTIQCGRTTSSVSWIEVTATAPGAVTLAIAAGTSTAKTVRITVVEG